MKTEKTNFEIPDKEPEKRRGICSVSLPADEFHFLDDKISKEELVILDQFVADIIGFLRKGEV